MGIMTVGLLGVASVFPVGSWYMQKANIADQSSAIAQTVMNEIVTTGMLNPGAWYVMTPAPMSTTVTTSPNFRFITIDGKYSPLRSPVPGTFTRPFAESLREGLKINATNPNPVVLAKQFGNAYVIDPMFAAAATNNLGNGNNNVAGYAVPASACFAYPWASSTYYGTAAWDPWRGNNTGKEPGRFAGPRSNYPTAGRWTRRWPTAFVAGTTIWPTIFRSATIDLPCRIGTPPT